MTQYYQPLADLKTRRVNVLAVAHTGALAPHTATTRWTYTVPSNKAAFLNVLQLWVWRYSAPTAAGIYQGEIRIGATALLIVRNVIAEVGRRDGFTIGDNIQLWSGQSISFVTIDTSSGGSVVYEGAIFGWEIP